MQGVDDIEGVVKGDGRISFRWMEMDGKKPSLISEMIKGDLIALEVAISFPGDFIDSGLTEGFKTVEEGDFGGPHGRGMVNVLEELQDVFAVFRHESKALVAVIEIVERLG